LIHDDDESYSPGDVLQEGPALSNASLGAFVFLPRPAARRGRAGFDGRTVPID